MPYLLDADHPQNDFQLALCIKQLEYSVVGSAAEGSEDDELFDEHKRKCMRAALSKPRQVQRDVVRHITAVETAMKGQLKSISCRFVELQKRLFRVAAPYLARDPGNPSWVKSIISKMKDVANRHVDNLDVMTTAEGSGPLVAKLIPLLRLNVTDMCPSLEEVEVGDIAEFRSGMESVAEFWSEFTIDREDYKAMLRDMPELNNDYEAARSYDDELTQQLIAEFEGHFDATG